MTDLALTIPANPGIRELTDIEIDQVEGGILPIIAGIVIIGGLLSGCGAKWKFKATAKCTSTKTGTECEAGGEVEVTN